MTRLKLQMAGERGDRAGRSRVWGSCRLDFVIVSSFSLF